MASFRHLVIASALVLATTISVPFVLEVAGSDAVAPSDAPRSCQKVVPDLHDHGAVVPPSEDHRPCAVSPDSHRAERSA